MRRRILSSLVIALLASAPLAVGAPSAGSLDGRTFKVTLTQPDGKQNPDTLAFASGTFDSEACHAYGFGKAAYRAKKDGAAVVFDAVTTSATEGKGAWKGKVDGSRIEGTVDFTDPAGKVNSMRFEGKAKS